MSDFVTKAELDALRLEMVRRLDGLHEIQTVGLAEIRDAETKNGAEAAERYAHGLEQASVARRLVVATQLLTANMPNTVSWDDDVVIGRAVRLADKLIAAVETK